MVPPYKTAEKPVVACPPPPQRGKRGRSGRGNLHHMDDLDRMSFDSLVEAVGEDEAKKWEEERREMKFDEYGFPVLGLEQQEN